MRKKLRCCSSFLALPFNRSDTYFTVTSAASLEACKVACVGSSSCKGTLGGDVTVGRNSIEVLK